MLKINFPIVKVKHIKDLSFYNHNVYLLNSRIDGSEKEIYLIELCDDDNLMTYQLTKNPQSKNFEDVLFEWETSWEDRIRFDQL